MQKKNRLVYTAVLLIVILLFAGFIYANRSFLQVGSLLNERQTIFTYESGQQFQFEKSRDNVLVVNNEGITCISQSGNHLWNIVKHMSVPSIQTNGNYTLLFDRGGKELSTYNGSSKMAEIATSEKIITAKINSAGYIALVTNEVGYKAKIEVYDQRGQIVYKWSLGESHPVDVDISPDCKQLVAATLCTTSGKITGNITFVDIDKEKVISETKRENSILIAVKYNQNGSLIALGESELLGFNQKCENKWNISYEGRTLQSFHLENENIVLALVGSRNNTTLNIYDNNGKKRGEYHSDFQIKSLDVSGGTIAVSEQREIKLLNFKGKPKSQKTVQKDVQSIILLPQDKVAVVGGNSVDIIKP